MLENPDIYVESDDINLLPIKLEELKVREYDEWHRTSLVDAMCLPCHGGWIVSRVLLVRGNNKFAGRLYGTDSSLILPTIQNQKK